MSDDKECLWCDRPRSGENELCLDCLDVESKSSASDVTGRPWPDCLCNDWRYENGHMQSCPAFGRTPDMTGEFEVYVLLHGLHSERGAGRVVGVFRTSEAAWAKAEEIEREEAAMPDAETLPGWHSVHEMTTQSSNASPCLWCGWFKCEPSACRKPEKLKRREQSGGGK